MRTGNSSRRRAAEEPERRDSSDHRDARIQPLLPGDAGEADALEPQAEHDDRAQLPHAAERRHDEPRRLRRPARGDDERAGEQAGRERPHAAPATTQATDQP